MMVLPDIEPKMKEKNILPVADEMSVQAMLKDSKVTEESHGVIDAQITGNDVRKASLRRLNGALSALRCLHDNDIAEPEILSRVRELILKLDAMRGWMYSDMVDWDAIAKGGNDE